MRTRQISLKINKKIEKGWTMKNIACMGTFKIGPKLAEELLKTWLSCMFNPSSPSAPKVQAYHDYDYAR